LLSAFLLPTRVHERYVYYCVPFVTALAVDRWAWRPVCATLSAVGTAEMLSHLFVSATPESFAVSGTAAIGALLVLPWSWGVLAFTPEVDDAGAERPPHGRRNVAAPACAAATKFRRSRSERLSRCAPAGGACPNYDVTLKLPTD
jgi:hypothetical protein